MSGLGVFEELAEEIDALKEGQEEIKKILNGFSSNDVSGYLSTIKAAKYLDVPKRTLEGLRSAGGGPVFVKGPGKNSPVTYKKADLDIWAENRRRKSTCDTGPR
jgi:hypothetical protein